MPDSQVRLRLWDGWMRHRQAMGAIGLPFTTLLGGSFLTSKLDPGDVDLCYLLDGPTIDGLAAAQRSALGPLVDGSSSHAPYGCHSHLAPIYPMGHPRFFRTMDRLSYWFNVLGFDRNDFAKSFLVITEGGVL